jgi:hypothetical protein
MAVSFGALLKPVVGERCLGMLPQGGYEQAVYSKCTVPQAFGKGVLCRSTEEFGKHCINMYGLCDAPLILFCRVPMCLLMLLASVWT